jgi:hypothetical protein
VPALRRDPAHVLNSRLARRIRRLLAVWRGPLGDADSGVAVRCKRQAIASSVPGAFESVCRPAFVMRSFVMIAVCPPACSVCWHTVARSASTKQARMLIRPAIGDTDPIR